MLLSQSPSVDASATVNVQLTHRGCALTQAVRTYHNLACQAYHGFRTLNNQSGCTVMQSDAELTLAGVSHR